MLDDGRRLDYTVHGDPGGAPVVVLDGPCSRGLARAAGPIAAELGLLLVAPDRPGAFGSTPQPGRSYGDWPHDHAALLDALGIDRAGILGQSGGTPYSLAAAAALPQRTTAVALLGAMAPLSDRPAFRTAGRQIRVGARLAKHAPWLFRFALKRTDPDKAARKAVEDLPPKDVELMQDPRLFGLHLQSTREILGQPRAVAEELALLARPWGIAFGDVEAPVELWTGEGDPVHPVAHARLVAEKLGGPRVNIVPEAASFGLLPRYPAALRFASATG
jgi:pimeloyl-ACP methyl ester carboxylesterase